MLRQAGSDLEGIAHYVIVGFQPVFGHDPGECLVPLPVYISLQGTAEVADTLMSQ